MKRLALVALLLTGCAGSTLSAADKTARCTAFADKVSAAGLSATPSEQTAKSVADSLDPLLSAMSTPALHDPAVRIHTDLHAVEIAQRQGKTDQADTAANRVRASISDLAKACDLPESAFVGS